MIDTAVICPPIISAPLWALLLWAVALGLGFRALRTLRVPLGVFSPVERGMVCLAVGTGLLQYLPYALAAVGCLYPRNLAIAFGLLALGLSLDLSRIARAAYRELRKPIERRASAASASWRVALFSLLAVFFVHALAIGAFGSDDDGYHLTAPKRWLEGGTLRYLPTFTNTNASLGFEMLYALGLTTGNPGIKVLHFFSGVFMLYALWLAARRLGSPWAGAVVISGLLVSTPFCNAANLLGLAYVDFGACWMTVTSVLVWLAWREQRRARLLFVMAACAGFAASFKSTALSGVIAWAPVLIWEARRGALPWSRIATRGVGLGFVALLPVLPWLIRSWRVTGNPVFPLLSSAIPTRDWSPELAGVFGRFFHYYSWGVSAGAGLSEPQRKLLVAGTACLVVVVGALAVLRLRTVRLRQLALFATVFVLITVVAAGLVFRYWLPGQICGGLVAACAVGSYWRRGLVRRWLPATIACGALLLELLKPASGRPLLADLEIASGAAPLELAYAKDPSWRMWQFIQSHTSSDAHVLVAAFYTSFGAANFGCFWLDRSCYTTDSHLQRFIRLDDWQAFQDSLTSAKIQYVLISAQQFSPNRHGYSFAAGSNEYPFCRRLVDTRGVKLAQFGALQFYRLTLSETEPSLPGAAQAVPLHLSEHPARPFG